MQTNWKFCGRSVFLNERLPNVPQNNLWSLYNVIAIWKDHKQLVLHMRVSL